MHKDELHIDINIAKQLIIEQFPQWQDLSINSIKAWGSDNVIYRLGQDMCIRLPRMSDDAKGIDKDARYLHLFASLLPLKIPEFIAMGSPNKDYPSKWGVYRWLKGKSADYEPLTNLNEAAITLAEFIVALQKIDIKEAPISSRDTSLLNRDQKTRAAIKALKETIDTAKVNNIWDQSLELPIYDKTPVWLHSDLHYGNLLIENGKLTAVIDFGMMGIGDPAADYIAAWSLFDFKSRLKFKEKLQIDEITFARARALALSIAVTIIPYYKDTNPSLTKVAKRIIKEILDE